MIHVDEKRRIKQFITGVFLTSVVMFEVGGKSIRTLPKDVAFHPVKDRPLHADFLRVSKDTKVQVGVPVLFVNEDLSPGLKRGGVLNVVRTELELVCEADKLPDDITIDATGFDLDESIHNNHFTLPQRATGKPSCRQTSGPKL